MSRILDENLVCSFCSTGKCKLWRRRNDNWETASLYCLQCLIDSGHLVGDIRDNIDLCVNDTLCYPGPVPVLPLDHKDYLSNTWVNLPSTPEWWKYISNVNYNRASNIRNFLRQKCHDLKMVSLNQSFFIFYKNTLTCSYQIVLGNEERISIPEALHVISWLQNVPSPMSLTTFGLICQKIRNKHLHTSI